MIDCLLRKGKQKEQKKVGEKEVILLNEASGVLGNDT